MGGALCCDCVPNDMLKLVLLTGDCATGPGVCRHLFSTVMFKLRSGLHFNLGQNFICSGCFPYFSQSLFFFFFDCFSTDSNTQLVNDIEEYE